MSESYEVGTRAWQPDPDQGWVPSEVERKLVDGDKIRLVFRLDTGEVSPTPPDRCGSRPVASTVERCFQPLLQPHAPATTLIIAIFGYPQAWATAAAMTPHVATAAVAGSCVVLFVCLQC
jgi:hypothetical protein